MIIQDRSRYINEFWKPFPQTSAGYTDLAQITSERFQTAGRLLFLTDITLGLTSGGITRNFTLAENLDETLGFSVKGVLRPGDIVEIRGRAGTVEGLTLLVPSERGSPFGDLPFTPQRAWQWNHFLKEVRGFFETQGFVELRTPTLVPSPGLEPFLDPFETTFSQGSQTKSLYLPTSPEFHLKKALCLGVEKCFEMKECFRNGELSSHHQPEFLMLEWYRAYASNKALMADVTAFITHLGKRLRDQEIPPTRIIPMEDLWRQKLDFHLTPTTTREDLQKLADNFKIETPPQENFDDLFARIWVEKLEPSLSSFQGPVIIWHYPPSQAALARLTPEGWADRFEVYWKGLELANAFHELNDVREQRKRFEQDQIKKQKLGKKIVPVDPEFLECLDWGMPPASGIALGLERLFMALYEIETIDEVRLFPMKMTRRPY